jgi:hypothetical protein
MAKWRCCCGGGGVPPYPDPPCPWFGELVLEHDRCVDTDDDQQVDTLETAREQIELGLWRVDTVISGVRITGGGGTTNEPYSVTVQQYLLTTASNGTFTPIQSTMVEAGAPVAGSGWTFRRLETPATFGSPIVVAAFQASRIVADDNAPPGVEFRSSLGFEQYGPTGQRQTRIIFNRVPMYRSLSFNPSLIPCGNGVRQSPCLGVDLTSQRSEELLTIDPSLRYLWVGRFREQLTGTCSFYVPLSWDYDEDWTALRRGIFTPSNYNPPPGCDGQVSAPPPGMPDPAEFVGMGGEASRRGCCG